MSTGQIDRGGASQPLIELALARLREFGREPEAVFWTFIFPMIMSVTMAVAFPGSGSKPAVVGIEPGVHAAAIRGTLAHAPGVTIRDIPAGDEARALREGEVHLLIVPTEPPVYRFDPARDESRVALLFGVFVLGMPIRGSLLSLSVVCLVGALAFGSLGLLLASRARTFEAISGLMNFAMVPMWILSGVFFSSSNFPEAMQPAIQALPLTALNNALRSIVLEGSPLRGVGGELAVLGAWGIGGFALALRIFRWR